MNDTRNVGTTRTGITIIEVLALLAAVAILMAISGPLAGQIKCDWRKQRSQFNLATLNQAHALYAADWNDRQFTLVRDDLGEAGGDCRTYNADIRCHPGIDLGDDCDGIDRSIYFGCDANGGSCSSFFAVKPINFTGPNEYLGSFRIPNARGFNTYVNGRFFDEAFYAPGDPIYDEVAPLFVEDCEYAGEVNVEMVFSSSYVLSPAAMYDPAVFTNPIDRGFQFPDSLPDGYRSPSVSQARYPSQKSRMIEHAWLRNHPPGFELPGSYRFNHSLQSQPLAMMYDGSVRVLSVLEVIPADRRHEDQVGYGLWSRDTPWGADGYLIAVGFDFAATSYHILTTDGILGRDTLR